MSKQLDKARAAVKKKNFEYAAELYNLHLKITPGDLDARRELRAASRAHKKLNGGGTGFMARARAKKIEIQAASIRINKKDPEKSMIQCEDLLKQDPDALVALLRLGEAASYANLNEVAVLAFEDALSLDRQNKDALRLLGRVLEGTDNLERALKCFQRLFKLDPKDTEAEDKIKKIPARITSRGYEEGSKKGFQGLIDVDQAKKLEAQNVRIRTPEQALARIKSMMPKLEEDPKDSKTMRLIAELYVKADQMDDAIAMCERGIKANDEDHDIAELRGDLLLKKMEAVLKKLAHAHKKSPDDARIKAKYAQVTKQKMAFEVTEYRQRAESHPTEMSYRFALGKALYDTGNIDDAIPELQKAKGSSRNKTEAGFYLGQCYIKKKIYKLALKELDTARQDIYEMDDSKKEMTYLIARIYESAGKKEKAVTEYEAIVTADFNYKDVTQRLEQLSDF
ncbi:MAG: tetratricopeptide repeat protein [Planctomycetes bacterium]|nr:tetratricopeptide repeat protein [Planctomycetota bacterium]